MFENSERQHEERIETQANEIDKLKIKISILQEKLDNENVVSLSYAIWKVSLNYFLGGLFKNEFFRSA